MQDTITVSPDESSWQAGFGKLASTLFMSESLSDVKLVSVDGEEMPAHRLVLCAHSDMLLTMLCPSETTGVTYVERDGSAPVRIGETGATLRSLLSYMYTGSAELELGNALAVMKAARYFLVSRGRGVDLLPSGSFFF